MCVCSVCQRSGLPVVFDHDGNPKRVDAHKALGLYCDGDKLPPAMLEADDRLGTYQYPKNLYELMKKLGIDVELCGKNYCEQEQRLARRLSQHGYRCGRFEDGERDSFGPMSRVVKINNAEVSEWYMYG